jgi:hypothetical protein
VKPKLHISRIFDNITANENYCGMISDSIQIEKKTEIFNCQEAFFQTYFGIRNGTLFCLYLAKHLSELWDRLTK